MKKRIFNTAMIFALVIGMSVATGFINQSSASPSKETKGQVNLQNFQPEASVTYKIFSLGNLLFKGSGKTDDQGIFSAPYPSIKADGDHALIYDFEIQSPDNQKTLNVLMRVDTKSGQIIASGKGAGEFSNITITTPESATQTRADWAGIFKEKALLKNPQGAHDFQIVLHGADGFRFPDNDEMRPGIIHVLQAPGGGGPGSGGVNQFTPSPPPLSTSNVAAVQQSIENIKQNYIRAMMMMTEQLSAVQMQMMLAIGQFFDAKHQMETQRLVQQLKAEAVKDYHPSEQMCRVGSYIRSVAKTEEKAQSVKRVINEMLATRAVNEQGQATETGSGFDVAVRLKQYREVYCDFRDNNNGLEFMCDHEQDQNPGSGELGAEDKKRVNKDIDFIRTLDQRNTLEIDFKQADVSEDEEDIMALAKNLYWPEPINFTESKKLAEQYPAYLDARRLIAMNGIAYNSFASIVGAKANADQADSGDDKTAGWAYMKTLMREFGYKDRDGAKTTDQIIEELVGKRPSYWAQMDFLTKKMYQNPDFYTYLYDKPTNVSRMSVVLDAMKLMQLRDHYESSLRREMANSALLEDALTPQYKQVETILASPE